MFCRDHEWHYYLMLNARANAVVTQVSTLRARTRAKGTRSLTSPKTHKAVINITDYQYWSMNVVICDIPHCWRSAPPFWARTPARGQKISYGWTRGLFREAFLRREWPLNAHENQVTRAICRTIRTARATPLAYSHKYGRLCPRELKTAALTSLWRNLAEDFPIDGSSSPFKQHPNSQNYAQLGDEHKGRRTELYDKAHKS